ncbi:hypothetical protein E2986_02271 [Frieseomelitta varia]|uniref:Threonylcarbamoyl-AMP synthase n=2 Tax=Frieseomelitta varia TaxID=561572 RepID=A0A833VPT8_9HYME|nr:hypothetical protein E2986_02271 [Frieseomelitta varia]
MSVLLNSVEEEIEVLTKYSNHWMCKGKRSVAVASKLLLENKVVALPTDTIYGLACVVSNADAIEKLYEIKKRDANKPLSICVSNVKNIEKWGVVDHVPYDLLTLLLPGPYTIILKRTPALNPALNPDHDTVGIRIPDYEFINNVTAVTGPLALTSANLSNQSSCLYPSEFQNLWKKLDGIFYDTTKFGKSYNALRRGSTIVDLSKPGYYKIVRAGVGAHEINYALKKYNLQSIVD